MTGPQDTALLIMSFGGPESLDEIPSFLRSLMHRTPPPALEREITERYRRLGGKSPLPEVTRTQAGALERRLRQQGIAWPVLVGMAHAHPTLPEAVGALAGARRIIGLSLTPFRSQASSTEYEQALRAALDAAQIPAHVFFPGAWHLEPAYIEALAARFSQSVPEPSRHWPVIFSAHAVPERFIAEGDPYRRQLEETVAAVADRLSLEEVHLAFQSRGAASREPWIGPDVEAVMDRLKGKGRPGVVVDPIGFVSDHLETLYDNDIVHRAHAEELGLPFVRVPCLNTDPLFIDALRNVALQALQGDRVGP